MYSIWLHLSIQQAVDDDDDDVLYGRGHDVTRRSCVLVIVVIISLIWELRERRGREGGMERTREGWRERGRKRGRERGRERKDMPIDVGYQYLKTCTHVLVHDVFWVDN